MKTCDHCNKAAIAVTVDVHEGQPVVGRDGKMYATFRPGAVHYYCRDHYKHPSPTPPTIAYGYWEMVGKIMGNK